MYVSDMQNPKFTIEGKANLYKEHWCLQEGHVPDPSLIFRVIKPVVFEQFRVAGNGSPLGLKMPMTISNREGSVLASALQ